jgi:metal-sulfur cluster biosynthetic enzyme
MIPVAVPVGDPRPTAAMEDQVLDCLNTIIDPCSASAGCPAGLVDMGLVRRVVVDRSAEEGMQVSVTLALTHPFCMMAAVFVNEARIRIDALDGVSTSVVELDAGYLWTDDDLSPDYANRRRRSLLQRGIATAANNEITPDAGTHLEGART